MCELKNNITRSEKEWILENSEGREEKQEF